jgi:general secretion pathway protein D
MMMFGNRAVLLTLGIALAGCATDREVPSGQWRSAPGSTSEVRSATLQAEISEQLGVAVTALAQGRLAEARSAYQQVLALHPQHPAAQYGLNQVDRRERLAYLHEAAASAWQEGDGATALMHLNALLAEYPSNAAALELHRVVTAATTGHAEPIQLNAGGLEERLSLSFKEAPIEQVFEILSKTSNVNFLFDREVRGDQTVTIFLRDTTVADAMNLILMTNQLEHLVVDRNTVLIYPATSAKQREYQQLTIKAFHLVHGTAQSVANMLKSLLKARDIVVDERLNMLIMRDSAETIRLAERLVALHDVPAPEVMLEVTVLEVKRSRLQDLGVRWPDQLTLSPLTQSGSVLTLDDLLGLNSERIGVGIAPVTLNASQRYGDANILANPRIRAQNNEIAKILIGERVPNITATSTATGFVSESVQYVDVGLKLDVQPTVYPNDEVAIKVALEVSNIIRQISTSSGSVVFQIGTRTASTTLRLRDGENQVLAGLITDELRNDSHAIPGIRNVPLLGRLFGSERDESQKTEVVLSITPRLVRNVRPPSVESARFISGTEAAPRSVRHQVPAPAAPGFSNSAPAFIPVPAPAQRDTGEPSALSDERNDTGLESEAPARQPDAAQTDVLRLIGPKVTRVGELFSVDTQLLMPERTSAPLEISFDPQVLEVVAVEEGNAHAGPGYEEFSFRVDRELGRIYLQARGPSAFDPSAGNTLVTTTFRSRKAASATRIQVLESQTGPAGQASTLQLTVNHAP